MATYRGRTEDGAAVELVVDGATIAEVRPLADAETDDLPWLLPVLVDLQQNGGLGCFYNELHKAEPAWLPEVAAHLRRHGVGRCLLTFSSYPLDDLIATAVLLGKRLDSDADLAALYPAIFHEGVFISPEDGWRGAHNEAWIVPPDYDHIRRMDDALGGRIRMVNVAPEVPGGLAFVSDAAADGKLVAIGHSGPDADTIREAVERGVTLVTHFGNGAPAQVHRHHNPFWTFLADERLRLGLIGDGFHLPPDLIRAALNSKERGGCFMVSDAGGHAGCPPGKYRALGSRDFVIREDGLMHLADSELLCGAWFQLDRSVEFLVEKVGLSLLEAWQLCSRVPAAIAGIELPEPVAGAEASFVLARWDDGLVLDQCVYLGNEALTRPFRPTDL